MARRSERLLELMQALRRRRRPVTGQVLAAEMGVSLRSLYRDIETLRSMGAAVDGEAGLGYQLRADYFMPPLMFSGEEVEALVLGLRLLVHGPDAEMATTARDALSKVAAVLPEERRQEMDAVGLFAIPRPASNGSAMLGELRRALREERQAHLGYRDLEGRTTERVIYPVALGYYEDREVLVAWCTLRNDYRRFRIDGVASVEVLPDPLPEPRRTLFHRWRTANNLPELT